MTGKSVLQYTLIFFYSYISLYTNIHTYSSVYLPLFRKSTFLRRRTQVDQDPPQCPPCKTKQNGPRSSPPQSLSKKIEEIQNFRAVILKTLESAPNKIRKGRRTLELAPSPVLFSPRFSDWLEAHITVEA